MDRYGLSGEAGQVTINISTEKFGCASENINLVIWAKICNKSQLNAIKYRCQAIECSYVKTRRSIFVYIKKEELMAKKKTISQSEIDGVRYRRTTTGKIILSQFTYLPMVMLGVLLTYVSYLQSAGYGIATAVAGVILTGITLFDGVTDPIAARIIDNINTKHGKIRILLAASYAFSALSIFVLYFVTGRGGYGMWTFILVDAIFYIGYTFYCVTQQIISPVLTNDPEQRPTINMWATLVGVLPPIIFMVLVSVLMLPKYGNEYTLPLLREMAAWVLIIGAIALALSFFGLKDADKPENFEGLTTQKEIISFKDMVKMFKENKALQAYFWSAASDRLATTMSGQAVITTLLGGVLFKNMAMNSTVSMIPMVIGMIALFPIARKNGNLGSKAGMKFWTKAGLAILVVQFVFYLALMVTGNIGEMFSVPLFFIVFVVVSSFRNIAVNGNGNATAMMMSDVIDYQCYLTGKYMPAAVSATYSFLDKFISAFGQTICLGLLALVGYTSTMPQPTDEATMPIFWVTMFISMGTVAIGWIINLLAMKINPLTKEMMVEVQKGIADKKEALENEA